MIPGFVKNPILAGSDPAAWGARRLLTAPDPTGTITRLPDSSRPTSAGSGSCGTSWGVTPSQSKKIWSCFWQLDSGWPLRPLIKMFLWDAGNTGGTNYCAGYVFEQLQPVLLECGWCWKFGLGIILGLDPTWKCFGFFQYQLSKQRSSEITIKAGCY